jgi:hypothetical protein
LRATTSSSRADAPPAAAVVERAVSVALGAGLPREIGEGLTHRGGLRRGVGLDAGGDLRALCLRTGIDEPLGVAPRDLAPGRDDLEQGHVVGRARQVRVVDRRVEATGDLGV